MKLLLACVMILAIVGLWQYNVHVNAMSERASLAAQNHKPFQPVGSVSLRRATATSAAAPGKAACAKTVLPARNPARPKAIGPNQSTSRSRGAANSSRVATSNQTVAAATRTITSRDSIFGQGFMPTMGREDTACAGLNWCDRPLSIV